MPRVAGPNMDSSPVFLNATARDRLEDPAFQELERRAKDSGAVRTKLWYASSVYPDDLDARTARIAEKFGYDKDKIVFIPELYLAGLRDFVSAVSHTPPAVNVLAIFSHNPGITEFINTLTNVRIDDMPTCAVFIATIDIDNWRNFEKAEKQFLLFDYPKSTQH